jgi:hypothetical protein
MPAVTNASGKMQHEEASRPVARLPAASAGVVICESSRTVRSTLFMACLSNLMA